MSSCLERLKVNSFEQLREKRLAWVLASRDNDFEAGIKNLLTALYPDNAHFIYELLQNAEDSHAKIVRFTLTKTEIEFEHDGEKLFSLENVCSITSIGASTKRDDPTNIGKFGVGFKAVFAYTNTPEIFSGDFHFRIHDLVVPEANDDPSRNIDKRVTRFVFPFNNPAKTPTKATEEAERGLRSMGDNTLLFLKHIRKIEYLLPDGALGSLERFEPEKGRIDNRASQPGKEEIASHWLRFDDEVDVTDEEGKLKACRIAIAYRLVEEKNKNGDSTWKIVPLDQGQVSIYFPAEKETSKLRFHLHAPFASTVGRDSVRDCEANNALLDHIGQLVAESLVSIRDQGLLTVGFLSVLPIPGDNLSSFYEPIRQRIVDRFKKNDLVPVRAGGHSVAVDLVRCPGKFIKDFSDDDISLIAGKSLRVAANPQQNNQREDQFLKSLGIGDWGWRELSAALSSAEQRSNIEEWIARKDDDYLNRWYALLHDSKSQGVNMAVGNVRIVRARSISCVTMCLPRYAYFPVNAEVTWPDDVHFVDPAFCSGDSRAFLESIGVRPYDEKAAIERILDAYKLPGEPCVGHADHIRMFISFWKKSPSEIGMFLNRYFLLGKTSEGGFRLMQPAKLFLDSPYQETLLSVYYELLPEGKCDLYALAATYCDEGVDAEEMASFAKAVGVRAGFEVQRLNRVYNNPDSHSLTSGGVDRKSNDKYRRSESDFDITEFQTLLTNSGATTSRLIWKTMSESVKKEHLLAKYQRNNYSDEKHAPSRLVHRLRSANWIPQAIDQFVKPAEAKSSELPPGFLFDPGQDWLKAIGFGADEQKHSAEYQARDRMARDMGLPSGDELAKYLDAIKESGLTPEQIRAAGAQRKQISQPEESVKDPEKRRQRVREDEDSAPTKDSVIRERSIQPDIPEITAKSKAYLRVKYKNHEGQLVCQCCQKEMPFKLPSGDDYFEAVQCVRNQVAHFHQNRLALCPTCAAMYQYARESGDAEIRRRIVEHDADDQSPAVDILVRLAGRDRTLRFVGTHWFDLKTILGVSEVISVESGVRHG